MVYEWEQLKIYLLLHLLLMADCVRVAWQTLHAAGYGVQ